MPGRIAVLCHEADRDADLSCYVIHHFARFWREDGYDVEFVFGTGDFVPADVAVLHVDLSVVPDEYLRFTQRYPVALNSRVRDIRKSTISRHVLRRGEPYDGPVIVKSDLNYAGCPERARDVGGPRGLRALLTRAMGRPPAFGSSHDYRIFGHVEDVPRAYFRDPEMMVERFLPERDGDLYVVRLYHFLGDQWSCSRMTSREPIVTGRNQVAIEPADPHPEIVAERRRLGFDYGKFDYVVHDGRPVLLDTNKTTGVGNLELHAERLAKWRRRAGGIAGYFDRAGVTTPG